MHPGLRALFDGQEISLYVCSIKYSLAQGLLNGDWVMDTKFYSVVVERK